MFVANFFSYFAIKSHNFLHIYHDILVLYIYVHVMYVLRTTHFVMSIYVWTSFDIYVFYG